MFSDPDRFYTDVLEPLLEALNRRKPDFAKLRAALPSASGKRAAKRSVHVEDFTIVRGSLDVAGAIALEPRAMLVVLGDVTAAGLYAPRLEYTAVVVGGVLRARRAYTSGDVIAFGGIEATDTWCGIDNDYSAYAPQLDSIRAGCGVRPPRSKKPKPASATERDAIASELAAAVATRNRTEKVARMRAVYARIKRGNLADLGDLIALQIEWKAKTKDWSLQDELELLAHLGRADLLESLPKKLRGYESWLPGLIERARVVRGT